ncbi:MAG: AMP-binding protein [Phototrophicaceae bacterium]
MDKLVDLQNFQHLVALLNWRGQLNSDQVAVTYLKDGEDDAVEFTYSQLDRHARAIGKWLQSEGAQGERVLLMYQPGLEYIASFFGCLYGGAIAVPAYPPRRIDHANDRLRGLIEDCSPKFVFAGDEIFEKFSTRLEEFPELKSLHWMTTTDIPLSDADQWTMPDIDAESIAFLQYTSGSTSTPKGVIVKHGNIMDNQRTIKEGYAHDKPTFVTWLPMYHDMGLIGNIMQPLYCGSRTIAMSPTSFLQHPYRWLRAITKYQGQTSGAPNFAYDLCSDKITAEEKATLDLSSWTIAYNGAEPIRSSTLVRFAESFAECGFNAGALYPCYGLAEATLFVSGGPKMSGAKITPFDADLLKQNKVQPISDARTNQHVLVGSGVVWGQTVRIVNPDTQQACMPDEVGEIWIKGGNVAGGYWNRPQQTQETFGAYIASSNEGPFLRTGDLGFLSEDALFVTGRIKDMIIIRGRNYYPQDIEQTVERSHPALRPGCGAVFSIEHDGDEKLVVVQELNRQNRNNYDAEAIFNAIRQAVIEEHQVVVHQIALIDTLGILKTSSGKIQRRGNKNALFAGSLPVLEMWIQPTQEVIEDSPMTTQVETLANPLYPTAPLNAIEPILEWLRGYAETRINSFQMDERRTIAPHIVLDMGNRGLLGLQVPKQYGGLELSSLDTMRIIQQLGAVDQTLALFVGLSNILGIRPIMNFASEPVREHLLPLLATGRELAAFALTETGAGSNPRAMVSSATPSAEGWLLNGHKIWSGVAQWAGLINVFVKELDNHGNLKGITAFVVRQGTPGLRQGAEALTLGMRGMIQNEIFFDAVPVHAEQILGEAGKGMDVAQDAMMYGRLAIASCSVGAMKRSAQLILRYAERRTISTGNLLHNPILQAHLSQLVASTDAVDALVTQVCLALDQGIVVPDEIFAVCKISGPELGWQAVDTLVQFLGGRGYIETNQAPQMLRDIRILRVFEGPTETLKMYLGSRVLNHPQVIAQFVSNVFGVPAIADQIIQTVTTIRERIMTSSYYGDETARLQWAYNVCGDLANWGVLLASTVSALNRTQSPRYERVKTWVELQFEQAQQQAWSGLPMEKIVANHDVLKDLVNSYYDSIGDIQQTLAGDDRMMNEWIRRDAKQDSIPSISSLPKIDLTVTTLPTASSDVQETVAIPSVIPSSTSQVYSATYIRKWILNWMSKNLEVKNRKLDPDKAFAEYGVDSVKAVEFAFDLEQWLGGKLEIDEVITWNFPTPNALAKYIETELSQIDMTQATASASAESQTPSAVQSELDDIAAMLAREIEQSKKP